MGEKHEYIASLEVISSGKASQAPMGRLREFAGRSENVNHGYSDNCVWLVPTYTTTPSLAATGFDIMVQGICDASKTDYAPGLGTGKYRYIVASNDIRVRSKIVSMCLFRAKGSIDVVPIGWDGRSACMNQQRSGDYMYLLWKVAVV